MNDEKRVVECANWTQWKWEIYKLLWFVNVCCYCEEVNSLHSVYLQIFILYQQQDQASNHHKFQTNNTTWVLSQLTNSKLTFHPPESQQQHTTRRNFNSQELVRLMAICGSNQPAVVVSTYFVLCSGHDNIMDRDQHWYAEILIVGVRVSYLMVTWCRWPASSWAATRCPIQSKKMSWYHTPLMWHHPIRKWIVCQNWSILSRDLQVSVRPQLVQVTSWNVLVKFSFNGIAMIENWVDIKLIMIICRKILQTERQILHRVGKNAGKVW